MLFLLTKSLPEFGVYCLSHLGKRLFTWELYSHLSWNTHLIRRNMLAENLQTSNFESVIVSE